MGSGRGAWSEARSAVVPVAAALRRRARALARGAVLLPAGVEAAFEFRDPSWDRPAVYRILEERNAALVWADRLGQTPVPPRTADHAYVRFHQGTETQPGYPNDVLRRRADEIAQMDVRAVRIYFNNDQGGAATRDANTMTELLRERLGNAVATPKGLATAIEGDRSIRQE